MLKKDVLREEMGLGYSENEMEEAKKILNMELERSTGSTNVLKLLRDDSKISDIEINLLQPFTTYKHPFKEYGSDKQEQLAESIKNNGVLNPIIVRPLSNGYYEILSGHNRVKCCKLLDFDKIPSIVKNLSDEEAGLVMADTNLCQRDKLLASERAFAYKLKYEILQKQGKVNFDDIAEDENVGRVTVSRYIKVTNLIDELMEMLDNKDFNIFVGVDISYLKQEEQKLLHEYITANNIELTPLIAKLIRELSERKNFSIHSLNSIFSKRKNKQRSFTLKNRVIKKYFDSSVSNEEIEQIIINLLEEYKESQS